jgi:hypothetical protein
VAPWNDCPVAAQPPYPFGAIGLGRGGSLPWPPINTGEGQTKRGDECKRRERIVRDTEKVKSKKKKGGGFEEKQ